MDSADAIAVAFRDHRPARQLETSLWRRPFIKDGAHAFTVESQPESVLLRKFGNLSFSILIVYRPDALQVRFVNSTVFPYAAHLAFNLLRERLHDFYYLVVASRFYAPRQLGFALQKLALVRTWRSRFANHKTRTVSGWHETVLVKRSLRAIVAWLLIATLITATDVAKAGPFRDFFRSRPHRSSHKHNETPPSDASTSQTSGSPVPAPPSRRNVRVAKAPSGTEQRKTDLPYGTPVPGKRGLVTSPFAPDSGYVDVRTFPPGTVVNDPYTGKIFLTP